MRTKNDSAIEKALIQAGLVSEADVIKAREEVGGAASRIRDNLIERGLVDEVALLELVSKEVGVPYMRLRGARVDAAALDRVPARYADHYGIFPLGFESGVLTLVLSDPEDILKLDEIRQMLKCEIRPVLSSRREIIEAISTHYGVGADILERLAGRPSLRPEAVPVPMEAQDASVMGFVDQLLREAHRRRASDVHLEPFEGAFQIRHRVDGVLYETKIPPAIAKIREAIVSRIKIMANLDIAEKMLPQDGRFRLSLEGKSLDVRVSILPTPFGESVTLRLLTDERLLDTEGLGFGPEAQESLKSLIRRPNGMILLTGPTGSGKSTTLYAFLRELNRTERKILTIEDPIEFEMRGITQIQIRPKTGLTFARGLRSMLRHDPDVMMVGEIRDFETAEVTIRVALTGHLVFSTLHTNDAPGAVTRLLDIGIEPYLVASCLQAVIGQRLVRLICSECRERVDPPPEILMAGGGAGVRGPFFTGRGCSRCSGTGYLGRTVIYEILELDDDLRNKITGRSSAHFLRDSAFERGMASLRECGWRKVSDGLTTVEEVLRVTQAVGGGNA